MPAGRPQVTLRDVASDAGVSVTTASFVLSGRRDMRISPATEERVLQTARMLGYQRRLAPRKPPQPGSPAVGLVSDTLGAETFAGEMIRGCVAAAADRGHTLLMVETEGARTLEISGVQDLLNRGVERFVYGTTGSQRVTLPEALRGQQVVLMNGADGSGVPAVLPDDRSAGSTAADAILAAGHTSDIWLVGHVPRGAVAARRRLAGVEDALRARGLRLAGHVQCRWWPKEAREAIAPVLGSGRNGVPTAVITMNDRTAMGVYQAASSAGVSIPTGLSVISFDNSDLAGWLSPGLTSLALPYYELGRHAVDLLFTDPTSPTVVRYLPMALTFRGSVGPPRDSARPDRSSHAAPDLSRQATPSHGGQGLH
jgi:LacI family transcriptional regulator